MKKPTEMTPQSFGELLREAISERAYENLSSRGLGIQKAAAQEAQVSPARIGEILRGDFPGETQRKKREPFQAYRKRMDGAVSSVTRICDTFGLDLDACLEACHLPRLLTVIVRSRETRKALVLDAESLRMLLQQVEIVGPIPLDLAGRLVERYRMQKVRAELDQVR